MRGGQVTDDYEDKERGGKNKKRPNIWEETKIAEEKIEPKVNETIEHENVYEINVENEKKGTFISEFKNYLSNKKKVKEESQIYKNKTLDQSFNLSQLKNASSLSQSKSKGKDG